MSKHFESLRQVESELTKAGNRHAQLPDYSLACTFEPRVGPRTYEALCKLVRRLFLTSGHNSRCILFAGAAPGVGCTWVSVHVAQVLASLTAAQVCLVEASTTPSWLSTHFNISDLNNSSESETFNHMSAKRVGSNLWLMPADADHLGGVIESGELLEARIEQLKRDFDYVLLDVSSMSDSSRSLAFAPVVDGAILVLKAGQTSRPVLQRSIKDFQTVGMKVIGTVLNQREYPIPASIYKRFIRP
jgi:Mrp family chromosome partitioning ATPase